MSGWVGLVATVSLTAIILTLTALGLFLISDTMDDQRKRGFKYDRGALVCIFLGVAGIVAFMATGLLHLWARTS